MARYLLAPTSTSSALLPKDAAKNSPPSRTLRLPVLGSRSGKARPIMAVASEQTATPAKYPKVAAPTTGPIPAAELLGVMEAAAKAGADVSSRSLCCLMLIPQVPVLGLDVGGDAGMWLVSSQSCIFVELLREMLVV